MADAWNKGLFCTNPFHTIKFFVMCQGFLHLTQLLTSSYMKSSISTIEKRFGLSSQTSGLIASFNEVGNTILIVFVSYFGSRVHRPRLIGCGAILVSLSAFIISLPHFISGRYEYDWSISGDNRTGLCSPNRPPTSLPDQCSAGKEKEQGVVLMLLLFGQTLLGVGGVPIQPFGISYIDDFASKINSPLYLGILFAASAIGPALAFLLGAITLRFYVDMDKVAVADIHIDNKDPRWVGAWWLGFMFAAALVALSSVPYFFFPRQLPKEDEDPQRSHTEMNTLDEANTKPDTGQDFTLRQFIRLFPVTLLRNLKNPVYLMTILALINVSAMIAGLATFLAKFLERQFALTASFANMLIGAVYVPAAMFGMVLGGAIMKKCHLSLRKATVFSIATIGASILLDIPLMFLGCPTQAVAGLGTSESTGVEQHIFECNRVCDCSFETFNPVCGQDNMEYISPCFAGCSAVNIVPYTKRVLNYTRCNCVIVNGALGHAFPGTCSSQCSRFLIPFVVLAGISAFLASLSHAPAFTIILRSVKPEDKSFAIGIQYLLIRVGAWLPAPVLFGSIIDTGCLLWQLKCDKKAACRYYNTTMFRHRFIGVQILFELLCFLSFSVVYLLLWREGREEIPIEMDQIPEAEMLARPGGSFSIPRRAPSELKA